MARADGAGPEFQSFRGRVARRTGKRGRTVHVFLFLYDRTARAAHDHRHWPGVCNDHPGVARQDSARQLRQDRSFGTLLALRRYHLDLSVSFALSHRRTLQMSQQSPSVRTYTLVFVALLILAALTTGIAYIDLGPFNTIVALAIAFIKMCLVGLFFMELFYTHGLTRIVVLAGFFSLALMVSFTLADVFSRSSISPPGP